MTVSPLAELTVAAEADDGLFRLLAEQWPGAVLVLDRKLRVLWSNHHAAALAGAQSMGIVPGTAWRDLGLPWSIGADQLQQVIARGRDRLAATPLSATDGSRRLHTAQLTPLRVASGAVTAILCRIEEVTDAAAIESHEVQRWREAEAVLRPVIENTPDWLYLIDQDFNVRYMNRSFGEHQVADVLGRSILELIPKGYRSSLEALYRSVFRTGRPARFDLRVVSANDNPVHHEHRIMPVTENGVVRSLTVAVSDVTERKRAEIALRESQSTLQTIADSSADWLLLFDLDRRCVFLNRSIRGIPPAAWIGARGEDFAPPHDRERMRQIFERALSTGEPANFDQVFTEPDGRTRYLEMRLRVVKADGRILGAVVNVTELTERYQQQCALRTQARILETMREGVVLMDARSCITLTNPTFDAMFGYPAGELLGKSIEPLYVMSRAQRRRLGRILRMSANESATLPFEFECVRRDGTHFVASCVITPIAIGEASLWLAVLNDVTERKQLEREIIEIANREQQRIGSDLHDGLGQELTGIALMLRSVVAQLRKEGSAARLDVEDVISLVNNAIESTRALARGLSPVSAERGGLTAALRTLAARASERYGMQVSFEVDVDEPLRLTEAAATHLYRIAQEALTNVIRHSKATQVAIRLESTGDELQLKVQDNGRGFAGPLSESYDGLGLKIMRYRAQMLGGDLVLEVASDGGALVRCSCPLDPSGSPILGYSRTVRRKRPAR